MDTIFKYALGFINLANIEKVELEKSNFIYNLGTLWKEERRGEKY